MEIRGHTFSLSSRPGKLWDFNITHNATGSTKYLGDVSYIIGVHDRGSDEWLDAVDHFLSDEALIYEEIFPELSEHTSSWKLREGGRHEVWSIFDENNKLVAWFPSYAEARDYVNHTPGKFKLAHTFNKPSAHKTEYEEVDVVDHIIIGGKHTGPIKFRETDTDVDLRAIAIKSPAVRKRLQSSVNDQLYGLVNGQYFHSIPLDRLLSIVENTGFVFDPEEVPFALLGKEGRANIPVKLPGFKRDYALTITWYKMPVTGKYEVIAYFS